MGWLTGCFQSGMYKIKYLRAERSLSKITRKCDLIKNQIKKVEKCQQNEINSQVNALKYQTNQELNAKYAELLTNGFGVSNSNQLDSTQRAQFYTEKSQLKATADAQLEIKTQQIKEEAEEKYEYYLDGLQQQEESLILKRDQCEHDRDFYKQCADVNKPNKDTLKMLLPENSNG